MISDRKNVFFSERNLRERGRFLTDDRKKDVSEGNQMERRFQTETRFFLGDKPDRKKTTSDKKDISEGNMMERRRILTECAFGGANTDRKIEISDRKKALVGGKET